MDTYQKPNENDNNRLDDHHLDFKNNKCYNELNRLLYSKHCICFYVIVILVSLSIFVYSFIAHFLNLSKIIFSFFNFR